MRAYLKSHWNKENLLSNFSQATLFYNGLVSDIRSFEQEVSTFYATGKIQLTIVG